MKLGFIGLGSMGAAIARNLLRAGHELAVHNRTPERAAPLVAEGARLAASPGEAARHAEVVFTMLADDPAVEAMVLGSGSGAGTDSSVLAHLPPGAIHVSLSTISVALSERMSREHAARGQLYVAAPVFGRPDAAAAAKLFVVAAGPDAAVERCLPLFSAIGQGTHRLGPDPQRANLLKLCGNFLIVSMIETLGESFALARKGGIAPADFHAVLKSLIGGAPVLARYAALIADSAFEPAGFELRLGLKDLRLLLEAAEGLDVTMPISEPIRESYLQSLSKGRDTLDWSAIALISAERAGLADPEKATKKATYPEKATEKATKATEKATKKATKNPTESDSQKSETGGADHG